MTTYYGIQWKCEGPFQVAELKEPKSMQHDKVLYIYSSALLRKTGPMITEKADSLYNEIKITVK
jgi:hypothetical protein